MIKFRQLEILVYTIIAELELTLLLVSSEGKALINDTFLDEAIDLTIIVGQQILCRVTYVESFEKFYIQLDLEKAKMVEEAIANFDAAKVSFHN